MLHGEINRRLRIDGKGMAGSISLRCDWADVDPIYNAGSIGLPVYNESWPGITNLRCINVDMDESPDSPGLCSLTAEYSTDGNLGEEFYQMSLEYSTETLDITKGYTWENAGTPVTIDIPTVVPVTTLRIQAKIDSPPDDLVRQAINHVNDRIFLGYAAGTMRFDGSSTDRSYDADGNVLSVNTTYTFTIRDRSFNEEWRPPLQARDIDGNEIIWQNIDNTQPYYTTDQAKIATPVWINQVSGQESNVAGVAGWDKPILNGAYRYDTCDFATILNLTKAIGDE